MGLVGVAPGTTTLTLPDGSTIALADWIDDQFYGTIQFHNGDSSAIEAFSSGRSQQIPGGRRTQTPVDTNIPRAGGNGLPKDWEMLVYGWGIKFVRAMRPPTVFDGTTVVSQSADPVLQDGLPAVPGSLSDPPTYRTAFNLDRVIYFDYQYNNKSYSQGVIQDYPQGHGITVFSTQSAFEAINNGVPSPRDRRALVLPVHERENLGYVGIFSPQTPLQISQASSDDEPNAPLEFVDLKLYKYGLIKRTVI